MNYDDLVKFIREDGCRVYVYKKKETIYGDARGTFSHNKHGPVICVANKKVSNKKKVETLLHEYGHYLQYRDGFMQYLDGIVDSYGLLEKWINKKIELTDREKAIVRNSILTMEYDAERRGYEQGCFIEPRGWDADFYLRGANSYMDSIKWEFVTRLPIGDGNMPDRKLYPAKILTLKELYAPLAKAKIDLMSKNPKPFSPSRGLSR